MLLTADIGNTNITLGLFDKNNYINEFRLASDKDLSKEEYENLLKSLFKDYDISGCVIASVVDELSEKFKRAVDCVFNLDSILVEPNINLGIKISTDNPAEVGADRIANAVAVSKKYSGAVIVIDFGTATTFDIINSKNEFLGGVISPGLNTQMKCLKNATSKLPKIEVSISSGAIGHNTTDAILSGVIRGSACMVDGLIEQCEAELGEKATIIATGGYCGLIANYLKRPFDKVNPILTLEGLKYIYEMNATRKNSLMF
jgi:type III pantothenate kinase